MFGPALALMYFRLQNQSLLIRQLLLDQRRKESQMRNSDHMDPMTGRYKQCEAQTTAYPRDVPKAPTPDSVIEQRLNELFKLAEQLYQRESDVQAGVSALDSRISPVLMPEPPSGVDERDGQGAATRPSQSCQLAERLDVLKDRLLVVAQAQQGTMAALSSVINRVQL